MTMFLLIGRREGSTWEYVDPSFQKPLTRRGFFVIRRGPALTQDRFVLTLGLDVGISITPAVEQLVLEDPIYCLLAPRLPRGRDPSLTV
jgi:hypothetical protein